MSGPDCSGKPVRPVRLPAAALAGLLLLACGSPPCSASSGSCGPCGPANCSGCCTSDGRCVVEVRDRDANCGFNGAACVDCAAMSKACSTSALACQ